MPDIVMTRTRLLGLTADSDITVYRRACRGDAGGIAATSGALLAQQMDGYAFHQQTAA